MLVVETAVGSGIIYAAVKRYQDHQKKKTVDLFLLDAKDQNTPQATVPLSLYGRIKIAIQNFRQDKIAPILGVTRGQQLQEFSSNVDEKRINLADKEATQAVTISSISLAFAAAGRWFYSPLNVFSLPGVIYTSRYIFIGSYNSLAKNKEVNIDVLYAILQSLLLLCGYYLIASVTICIYCLNRKMIARIKDYSKSSVIDVFSQQPRTVWLLADGAEVEFPFEALQPDDIVVVNAGETIPVDGTITAGMASVDQHILTGESQPVEKGIGDQTFALTMVLSGWIHIRVEKAGEETTAAQIAHILNQTVDFKTDMQLWAEMMTDKTAVPILLLSGFTFPFLGLTSALTILHAHPRNKLTIAAAVGNMNFLNLASQRGLLIKDGRTLELLNGVDTVVFDKTGTLTQEQPYVGQIYTFNGYEEVEILRYAAAAEYKQTHPIAKAILDEAEGRGLHIAEIDEADYEVGYGLKVLLDGQLVRVGSSRFIEKEDIPIRPQMIETQEISHNQGYSLIFVAIDDEVGGCIELRPTVRPEAEAVIKGLRERGIKTMYIISGDHETPTRNLSQALGIDHYFAETLPANKADIIKQLQNEGKSICYIGDGINDSIALKEAKVSISLRGASTIATDTAQVILMDKSLNQLDHLFDVARQYNTNAKTSFAVIVMPSLICIGGVFLLHFGLVQSTILGQAGLLAGVANSMWPLRQYRKERLISPPPVPAEHKVDPVLLAPQPESVMQP